MTWDFLLLKFSYLVLDLPSLSNPWMVRSISVTTKNFWKPSSERSMGAKIRKSVGPGIYRLLREEHFYHLSFLFMVAASSLYFYPVLPIKLRPSFTYLICGFSTVRYSSVQTVESNGIYFELENPGWRSFSWPFVRAWP